MARGTNRQENKVLLLVACSLLLVASAPAAPVVSNVWFAQRQNSNLVDVWYDLSTGSVGSVTVSLQFSTDDGTSWAIAPRTVTGDIGLNQQAGTRKHIVWDAGQDCGSLSSKQNMARVMADDGIAAPPVQPPGTSGTQPPNTPGASNGMTFLRTNAQGCEEYLWLKDSSVVVKVPAGEFWMGSAQGEGSDDERPQHKVNLSAYYIDKYDVTNRQFDRFVRATGYRTDAEKEENGSSYVWIDDPAKWSPRKGVSWRDYYGANTEDHPVVLVSWNDAVAYAQWAGKRLPTEAEWEKAARGADARKYPWGNADPTGSLANFADRNLNVSWADKNTDDGYKFTSPVGNYPQGASPCGCMDMAGNVWGWCNDWYGSDYYKTSPTNDPSGPASGSYRVVRGGGWSHCASFLRCAYRGRFSPAYRYVNLGFRCARSE